MAQPLAASQVSLPVATRPRTSLGTLYSDVEVAALRAWLGGSRGPALATAPTGSGLTTLVSLLLAEAGMDAVWVGCGTPRVKSLLAAAGSSPVSVVMRRKAIVVDEIDALGSAGETGALVEAIAFARSSPPLPILFIGKACRSKKPTEFARSWPKFPFARPTTPKVEAYLRHVALKHGIPGCDVSALAAEAKGDVRAALMAMDLVRSGTSSSLTSTSAAPSTHAATHTAPAEGRVLKDEAADGLDLVEAVLCGERGATVEDALRVFGKEPGMVAMGLYENYTSGVDVAGAAAVADVFSAVDVIDKYMYGRQAWDLHDAYGAIAVGGTAAAISGSRPGARQRPPRKRVAVSTFGSVWSKSYTMFAKMKYVKAAAMKYAEAGMPALDPCGLAFVRECLKGGLQRDDNDERLATTLRPLSGQEVLGLARLSVGGSSWYKASHQARIKRLLQ